MGVKLWFQIAQGIISRLLAGFVFLVQRGNGRADRVYLRVGQIRGVRVKTQVVLITGMLRRVRAIRLFRLFSHSHLLRFADDAYMR